MSHNRLNPGLNYLWALRDHSNCRKRKALVKLEIYEIIRRGDGNLTPSSHTVVAFQTFLELTLNLYSKKKLKKMI